jgi:hypothetical protein
VLAVIEKIGLAILLVALSGVAAADDPCKSENAKNPACVAERQGSNALSAPEMDPAAAIAGLTLALGGLAVLRGRRPETAYSR